MSGFEIRGVPHSVKNDGWWLSRSVVADGASGKTSSGSVLAARGIHPESLVGLLALVLLADHLFWRHPVGLSLAIFVLALELIVWLSSARRFLGRDVAIGTCMIAASVLPVIEQVQTLSIIFLLGGMTAFTVWAALSDAINVQRVVNGMARFALAFPSFALWDFRVTAKAMTKASRSDMGWRALKMAWGLPIVVGLVFVILLVASNPVMESWIEVLFSTSWRPTSAIGRFVFWAILAAAIWPFLAVRRLYKSLSTPFYIPRTVEQNPTLPGVNPTSIANSLAVFNLIFAIQTGLDLIYLWGGMASPQGVTHAAYAHRGAYPLVGTAVLAGLFATISRPFTEENTTIRWLLAIWLAQNVFLVLSSIYRLDLYTTSFGLTYLRIAAAIWMSLVASGLALTGWQIWVGASNGWLLQKNAFVLIAVLFTCCFVNFPHVIASTNLTQFERGQNHHPLDVEYLCSLGSMASAPIEKFNISNDTHYCKRVISDGSLKSFGWRDWGFRSWRVRGYLTASAKR